MRKSSVISLSIISYQLLLHNYPIIGMSYVIMLAHYCSIDKLQLQIVQLISQHTLLQAYCSISPETVKELLSAEENLGKNPTLSATILDCSTSRILIWACVILFGLGPLQIDLGQLLVGSYTHVLPFEMGSIEEKLGFESGEDIPLSESEPMNKVQSLNCETPHVLQHPSFSDSSVSREVHGVSILRSTYIVLIRAKINVLLPFGPLAILLHYVTNKQGWVFFFSLVGITPLAERLGYVTEQLAFYTGPTVGGLLNATFGNATEMIISMYALKNGMIRVVKQSLLGSILSNMLLVLGCAFFCGGIVHHQKVQKFNKATALVNSGLLLMAVMGLLFPAVLHFTHTEIHQGKSEIALSRFSSCIMLVAYASYIFFQLKIQSNLYTSLDEATENDEEDSEEDNVPEITYGEAIVWLAIVTLWISVLSGYLVDAIQGASDSMNIPVVFISVVLLPIVGNATEHASAIMFAMKDKLDITLGVAIGSSTQISMFVIPFCVIFGWILGKPMDLNFQLFETATLFITVLVVAFMLQEGQSNYFKGLMLILCYLIVAASFFVHVDS